ncbi:endonuclease [Legionella norrlandica]|uniref:Endonuclease n=1 Tax=Legionella norrlandica TaxID=1498499 RepID=A0A0A2SNI6_9GAMM|nr:endonuclease [Legionella norrlandica]
MSQGAVVITPNNRLSGAVLKNYFTYCSKKTVIKPNCLPLNTFLVKAYEHLKFQEPTLELPILFNSTQCQQLWRKLIKSHPTIIYTEGLLKAVLGAWEYCEQWQINLEDPIFHYTPQTQQFQQWWQIFNKQLQKIPAVHEHQLISCLIDANYQGFARTIVWMCFDDFNPQQLALQHYLNAQGIAQYRYDLRENHAIPTVFAAKDDKEEYQQLIVWLEKKLHQGKKQIGVVVPNLEQESHSLLRALLSYFDSDLFNISLGQPLSAYPLIAHALVWLSLDNDLLSNHEATLLLQSPYLGKAKEEFLQRSHYLQESKLLQNYSFSTKLFIENIVHPIPKLAGLLKNMNSYPEKATVDEWIALFQERLNILGFPGDYGLNSENYQCFNRFAMIFDEFRQLNRVSNHFTKAEALETLKLLTGNTIFQAQKNDSPIQILGLLEASGCEFDSLWVMGLTDQCLPQKTRLSPFIPSQLQRELRMPHSLPSRELQFARQILQRLQRGSPETVFSYSQFQEDTPNLPCALITHYPAYNPLPVSSEVNHQTCLIEFEEHYQVPLIPNEAISGGTSLLANQAKCPFKAFAEHRLKAKPSPTTFDGMDEKEKGQLIHKVLELLWQTLGNQGQLLKLNSAELEQCIDQAIQNSLKPLKQTHPQIFSDFIAMVEQTRLKRIILSYLEWEKQRPPFSIAALEENHSIHLAGLDFKVRVDRLDQVGSQKWIIDYKSTLPNSKPWNEERPMEPQLLLYALLDEQINTLLLIQLKTGKIKVSGFSDEKLESKEINTLKESESWEEYRQTWLEQLSHLAEEIKNGHCLPLPQNLTICQQCDFLNLCRKK